MAEEKKIQKEDKSPKIDRRSFLKGAASATAVAVTATSGLMALFPSSAVAQPPPKRKKLDPKLLKRLPRAHQILDPKQKEDDMGDMVNVYVAALDEGMTKGDKIVEKLITDEDYRRSFSRDSSQAVRSQVRLNTPFPVSDLKIPASILEKAKAAKAEGWHWHGYYSFTLDKKLLSGHSHLTW